MKKQKKEKKKKTSKKSLHLQEKILFKIQKELEKKDYSFSDLWKNLDLPSSFLPFFREVLNKLIEEKQIEKKKGKFFLKTYEKIDVIGKIKIHPRGFGFLLPSKKSFSQDIFIPPNFLSSALDGDIVQVQLHLPIGEKGPEGEIISILERKRKTLAGIIQGKWEDAYSIYVPLLGTSKQVYLIEKIKDMKIGDRILMRIEKIKKEEIICSFEKKIGHIDDASCDIKAAIQEFNLPEKFPTKTILESKKCEKKILSSELKKREDLTHLRCITIDPYTAKDFDDALSIKKDDKGVFHLGVHIADVAHYVQADSALDKEAFSRGLSTYFPHVCIPMLPEELSNNLCSLKPLQVKLTISVLMEFSPSGDFLNYRIVRSYIKSKKRFTYKETLEIIKKKEKSSFSSILQEMVTLALLFKKQRLERGSIDFSLPETKIIVDKNGEPTGIIREEYDISHQLVEEFMLKANEIVAKHLQKQGKMLIYRIHEEPDPNDFKDFYALAKNYGFSLPSAPTYKDIQKLFVEASKTPFLSFLSVSFIRSLKLAYYSPENIGHYGLALEHYCHFTSPIRRYSDLVIQRLLFDEQPKDVDLVHVANICSLKEQESSQAENSVIQLKKLRFLKKELKETPSQIYTGTLTRIKSYGFFFEVEEFSLEGFIHISQLKDDFYVFDISSNKLTGRYTQKTFAIKDKIKVVLLSIDLIQLKALWSLFGNIKKTLKKKKYKRIKNKSSG